MEKRKVLQIISAFILGMIIILTSTQVNAGFYEFFKGDFNIVNGHLMPKAGNLTCIQRGGSLSPNITSDKAQQYPVRI